MASIEPVPRGGLRARSGEIRAGQRGFFQPFRRRGDALRDGAAIVKYGRTLKYEAMNNRQSRADGHMTALLGAAVGAYIFCWGGDYLSLMMLHKFVSPMRVSGGLEGILYPFIGFVLGFWPGHMLGCWLLLKLLGYRQAGATAWILGGLVPVGVVLGYFLRAKVAVVDEGLLLFGPMFLMPLWARSITLRRAGG